MAELINFLGRVVRSPRSVGAIAPSSPELAALMADQVDIHSEGRVLELGPGTGAITQALIAHGVEATRITAIEADRRFVRVIARRFPGVKVVRGDAFDLTHLERDGPYKAVVSGIPLLNYPDDHAASLVEGMLQRLPMGAPFIQFSYGLKPPAKLPHIDIELAGTIWRNLPPAKVWVFRAV